eukprot:IDg4141t1
MTETVWPTAMDGVTSMASWSAGVATVAAVSPPAAEGAAVTSPCEKAAIVQHPACVRTRQNRRYLSAVPSASEAASITLRVARAAFERMCSVHDVTHVEMSLAHPITVSRQARSVMDERVRDPGHICTIILCTTETV